jgi:orotate phosphoribosyltransferase
MKSTNTDSKVADQVAAILYDIGAVILRLRQPFRYDSGILSPVYTDNRLIISHPKERTKIVNMLIAKIQEIGVPDVVAGTATAGIPHAAFIAQKLNIPMVYVRAEPKSHGKGNQVEGRILRGQKVIVVEDLVSTGGSSVRVAQALRKIGAEVTDEVAIFTYGLAESKENFAKSKIKLHTLSNLEHSVRIAAKKGYLKSEQVQIILDWSRDPHGWGKKMGFE